ncbi:MAG: YchJ family protein [Gammaproteobacteria bacterium]
MSNPCPCNPEVEYAACCGRYISGGKLPPTAEALMRSRFSAFAKQNANYLVATVLPEKRERNELKSTQKSFRGILWVKLDVLATDKGGENDDTGTVEFRAYWQAAAGREKGSLHERSTFVKQGDRWYYADGEQFPD